MQARLDSLWEIQAGHQMTTTTAPYEVLAYPAHAITPAILYLQVGDTIPAAAAHTAAGLWQIVVYDGDQADPIVPDENAARDWLETYGWERAA